MLFVQCKNVLCVASAWTGQIGNAAEGKGTHLGLGIGPAI